MQMQFLFATMWRMFSPDLHTREAKCPTYIKNSQSKFYIYINLQLLFIIALIILWQCIQYGFLDAETEQVHALFFYS